MRRPRTVLQKLTDPLVYTGLLGVSGLVNLLGARAGYAIASASARGWHRLFPERLKVIDRNLEFAFPEGLDDSTREKIRFECCRHALANLIEGFVRDRLVTPKNWREFADMDPVLEEQLQNPHPNGLAILSAHLGSWEMGLYFCGAFGKPVSPVMRRLDNPYLDRMSNKKRARFGATVIPKTGALRGILQELRSGGRVAIMADQSAPIEEGFLPFFGVRASTYQKYAGLLVRQECPVLFCVCLRDSFRFRFRFETRVLEVPADGNREERATGLIQNYLAALEETARKYPEQYLWMHKRFKLRPDGEDSPY